MRFRLRNSPWWLKASVAGLAFGAVLRAIVIPILEAIFD